MWLLTVRADTLDDARDLHRRGAFDQALSTYLHVAEELQTTDPAAAGTARNNACVILLNRGDYRAAREQCDRALELRRKLEDTRAISRTLNNLGLVLQHESRFRESEQRYLEALRLNTDRGDPRSRTINLANLGVLATEAGWYGKALDYLGRTSAIAAAHSAEDWAPAQRHLSTVNTAVVLEKIGAFRDALDLYREVLDEARSGSIAAWRADVQLNTAVIYRNLGDPYTALGMLAEAEQGYASTTNRSGLSTVALNRALVRHLNLAEPEAAEAHYREALELARLAGDRTEQIRVLYHLGHLMLELDRLDEARTAFAESLESAEAGGSAEGRWIALAGLARTARRFGDNDSALSHFRRALEVIENTRASLGQVLRGAYFANKRSVYSDTIDLLAELSTHAPDARHQIEALELVQRAKVRELIDALGGAASTGKPLTAEGLQARRGAGTLLEYWTGENSTWLWRVTREDVELFRLGPTNGIRLNAGRVLRSLRRRRAVSPKDLEALSSFLLPDGVRDRLAGGSLQVSPDLGIEGIPFEMLP